MLLPRSTVLALATSCLRLTFAIDLDVSDPASIKAAARVLAFGVQSYYTANATGAPETAVGTFPPPSYWWEGGAIWAGMIDYWAYTGDSTWNEVATQGMLAQANAPEYNYMPPAYYSSLGNDDQAFWALGALSALEYGFPVPDGQADTFWLDVAVNVYNSQIPRWDTSSCGGGLMWQIFDSNPGWGYKNSVSTGSLFQLAARLAHYTGNNDYVGWAEKIWDWSMSVGFISPEYQVFDGADASANCTNLNRIQWTYNPALLLYGTAMLADFTNDQVWENRTISLMLSMTATFFSPYENATNIMFEVACETIDTCNYDQLSFKAYLSRWMAKAAIVYPPITDTVVKYLEASAQAAARSCTGGPDGQTCGIKWYENGFDGVTGVGQELSALETIQALLLLNGDAIKIKPIGISNLVIQAPAETSTSSPPPPPPPPPTSTSAIAVTSTTTNPRTTASSSSPAAPPSSTYTPPPPPQPKTTTTTMATTMAMSAPSTSAASSMTRPMTDPRTAASSEASSMTASSRSTSTTTRRHILSTAGSTSASSSTAASAEDMTSSSTAAAGRAWPTAANGLNVMAGGALLAGLAFAV